MSAGRFCNSAEHANQTCCAARHDPCRRIARYSSGASELVYVQTLAKQAGEQCESGFSGGVPRFVIDSSRSGNAEARTADECHDWCNVKNAGAGPAPTTDTPLPQLVDAYYWVKVPGESDGCTERLPDGSTCERFDPGCGRSTSLGSDTAEQRAPEAGAWYHAHVLALARNAALRFDGGGTHGALRAEYIPADRSDSNGGEGSQLSRVVELWRPSPRCMAIIITVAIFAAVCAFGASLAFMAGSSGAHDDTTAPGPGASVAWTTFERVCPCLARARGGPRYAQAPGMSTPARARGHSAAGIQSISPSPRHRTPASGSVRYKCEPVLSHDIKGMRRGGTDGKLGEAMCESDLAARASAAEQSASECSGSDVELLRRTRTPTQPSFGSFAGSWGSLSADSPPEPRPPRRLTHPALPLAMYGEAPAARELAPEQPRSPRGNAPGAGGACSEPLGETAPNVLSDLESDNEGSQRGGPSFGMRGFDSSRSATSGSGSA